LGLEESESRLDDWYSNMKIEYEQKKPGIWAAQKSENKIKGAMDEAQDFINIVKSA
jgi:hypothetical protein